MILGSQVQAPRAHKLKLHLNNAWAYKELYYANYYCSQFFPRECVMIMHDNMDHAKIASPVFLYKTKQLDGFMKLLVSVTDILAHGHNDGWYAHYGLEVFAHDSNYIVESLAKLLRDLERPPKSSSQQLFEDSRSIPLFQVVLDGAKMCETSLSPLAKTPIQSTLLLPILNVQMDNATIDNKNQFVFCF